MSILAVDEAESIPAVNEDEGIATENMNTFVSPEDSPVAIVYTCQTILSTNPRGVFEVGRWREAADGEGGRRDREGEATGHLEVGSNAMGKLAGRPQLEREGG